MPNHRKSTFSNFNCIVSTCASTLARHQFGYNRPSVTSTPRSRVHLNAKRFFQLQTNTPPADELLPVLGFEAVISRALLRDDVTLLALLGVGRRRQRRRFVADGRRPSPCPRCGGTVAVDG